MASPADLARSGGAPGSYILSKDDRVPDAEIEVAGVVVARVCNEQISVKCDLGFTVSFRADWPLNTQLDLGQRAVLALDRAGKVHAVRLVDQAGGRQETP